MWVLWTPTMPPPTSVRAVTGLHSHMSWVTSGNNLRKSGMGMPGKRFLPRDCSSTTGNQQRIPEEPTLDGDMSHVNIIYWDGLGVHKVMNVK